MSNVVEERDGGVLLREFVHGQATDQPIVLDSNTNGDATATGAGDVRYYFLQDALGSAVGLMDGAGALKEGYLYDAYGHAVVLQPGSSGHVEWNANDTVAVSSALGNPYAFTGQRLDSETGLMYYRARYYDTAAGRFLSRDPIGVWGDALNFGNAYAYVGNNPLNGRDPSGNCGEWWNGWVGGCLWDVGTAIGNAGVGLGKGINDCIDNGLGTCAEHLKSNAAHQWDSAKSSYQSTWGCLVASHCEDMCQSVTGWNPIASLSCQYHACGDKEGFAQFDCYVSANIDFALVACSVSCGVPTILAKVEALAGRAYTFLGKGAPTFLADESAMLLPGLGEKVVQAGGNQFRFSPGALKQIADRGISESHVLGALERQPFKYFHKEEWRLGYFHPETNTFVGTSDGFVTTTMQGSRVRPYVERLGWTP